MTFSTSYLGKDIEWWIIERNIEKNIERNIEKI